VTFGAYAAAAAALGLEFRLADPHAAPATGAAGVLPQQIVLAGYPELKRLAWQLPGAKALTPQRPSTCTSATGATWTPLR